MDTAVDHSKRGHSRLSPSSLSKFEKCPSYKHLEREVDLHPVTAEGTFLHECLETGDFSKLTPPQRVLIDFCIKYIRQLPTFNQGDVVIEPCIDITPDVWGYVDRIQFNAEKTEADVVDWKFGWNRVEDAEKNPQGQAYVLGLFFQYPVLEKVSMHFVQPRLGHTTSHPYARGDITTIQTRIQGILTDVERGLIFRPEEGLCEYCGNTNCPIQRNRAQEIVKKYSNTPAIESTVHPSEMTKEDIAIALTWVPTLENWCKSVRHHATRKVMEGEELPGFDLKHRSGAKKVTDSLVAWDIVSRLGVNIDDFLSIVNVPAGKLEDLVRSVSPRGKKDATVELLRMRLEDADALEVSEEISYLKRNDQQIIKSNI